MTLPISWRALLESGLPIFYFFPRARTPFLFVQDVLGDSALVAVDVGARGDVPPPWLVLDGVFNCISFEPDREASDELRAVYAARGHADCYNVLPIALSGTGGSRTLFVPQVASGGSLLNPTTGYMQKYSYETLIGTVREVAVETKSPVEVFEGEGITRIDMIKLDVQGLELEILRGFGNDMLGGVMVVELEIAFQEHYAGQPTFLEIQGFFEEKGFEIFDIRTHRAFLTGQEKGRNYLRDALGVHKRSKTVAPKLWELDGIYFRTVEQVLNTNDPQAVRRLCVAYCTYNYFCEALDLIEDAISRDILSAEEGRHIQNAISSWHRRLRYRWLDSVSLLPTLIRRVIKWLRVGDQLRWARSIWLGYPSS